MIRNIVLAIVLAAQVAVWLIIDPPFRSEPPRSESTATKRLVDLDVSRVAVIEYSDATGKKLALAKRDDRWVVETLFGFPAMTEKVDKILTEFENLSRAEFRSDKRSMHENYDVDDKKGQHVRFLAADRGVLGEYHVGKRDIQGAQGTFIRASDQSDVYVARSQDMGIVFSADPYYFVKRGVFDVDLTDQNRMVDVKNACYRLEIEGRQPVRDPLTNALVDPPAFKSVRMVFEFVPAVQQGEEGTWRVVEPTEKTELVLGELQVRTLIQNLLSIQAMTVVAETSLPAHGLDDVGLLECRVTARMKDGDVDTSRVIEIGSEFDPGGVDGRPQAKQRFARTRHPGDQSTQGFVFAIQGHFPMIFLRDPESLLKPPTRPLDQIPPLPVSKPALPDSAPTSAPSDK